MELLSHLRCAQNALGRPPNDDLLPQLLRLPGLEALELQRNGLSAWKPRGATARLSYLDLSQNLLQERAIEGHSSRWTRGARAGWRIFSLFKQPFV